MAMTWASLLAFCLVCSGQLALGVADEGSTSSDARARRETKNGCEDLETIAGVEAIKYPKRYHFNFSRPWLRTDIPVKLFTSKSMNYNWNWLKELEVRGLNATVSELMEYLDRHNCLFIPYGEAVRGILLGSVKLTSPLRLEGESTCPVDRVYQLCVRRFGRYLCGERPTSPHHRVTFGLQDDDVRFSNFMVDPITIGAWNSTFNRPTVQWEFTANAVGLFDNTAGKAFIVDLTGRGVKDICQYVIALPVDPTQWEKWANKNLVKVLRYYNLEADGFQSVGGVRNFIMRQVKELYNVMSFQEYYCRFVYDGTYIVPTDDGEIVAEVSEVLTNTTEQPLNVPECRVVSPNARSARLIDRINRTLSHDFGDLWNNKMIYALTHLNFVNIGDMVFLKGAPTQASWPIFTNYDYVIETTTTPEPTEEYPGDFKYQEEELSGGNRLQSEEYSYFTDNSASRCFIFVSLIAPIIACSFIVHILSSFH